MGVEISEAEYLHEVQRLSLVQALCTAKLLDAGVFANLVDLCGDEKRIAQIWLADYVSERCIVALVSRPGIDDTSAVANECPEYVSQRLAALCRNLRNRLARPKPDDWE